MPDPCGFPLGGLIATDSKLACGFANVSVYGRDGASPEQILARTDTNLLAIPMATDGERIYMGGRSEGGATPLWRIDSDGSDLTAVACDSGEIGNQEEGNNFPIQYEYEMVVGDSDVFWIEYRMDGSDFEFLIRSTPK
jgi:hypothetical protein